LSFKKKFFLMFTRKVSDEMRTFLTFLFCLIFGSTQAQFNSGLDAGITLYDQSIIGEAKLGFYSKRKFGSFLGWTYCLNEKNALRISGGVDIVDYYFDPNFFKDTLTIFWKNRLYQRSRSKFGVQYMYSISDFEFGLGATWTADGSRKRNRSVELNELYLTPSFGYRISKNFIFLLNAQCLADARLFGRFREFSSGVFSMSRWSQGNDREWSSVKIPITFSVSLIYHMNMIKTNKSKSAKRTKGTQEL
jgi:hypothetical protein